MSEMAGHVGEAILSDLMDRRGIRQAFDNIDADTMLEIKQAIGVAAIQAMPKPTEAMLNAARDWSRKKYGKPIGNDDAIGCWHAMIDAALA